MAENTGFVVDVSEWRMGDYADFFGAGNKNDFDKQFELIAKIMKGWPYTGSPAETVAYRNLKVNEWQDCLKAVGEAIAAQFQRGN